MAGSLDAILALPGLQVGMNREVFYAVKVETSESQVETRTVWSEQPRFRYKIAVGVRGDAGELSTIDDFYQLQRGEWDSFSMVDPFDNEPHQARFEGPIKYTRFVPNNTVGGGNGGWWMAEFSVVTVFVAGA